MRRLILKRNRISQSLLTSAATTAREGSSSETVYIADGVGAEMENARRQDSAHFPQSSSVGVKGRPRSPLNSFFNRRSLELRLRRLMPGATSWLLSRRARRPLSQSSQLIEPSIGIEGIFDFKFIGHFAHQFHALWKVTIFRQTHKPAHFSP